VTNKSVDMEVYHSSLWQLLYLKRSWRPSSSFLYN